MKKIILLLLLSIPLFIFAEKEIPKKKIEIKDNLPHKLRGKPSYSGFSCIAPNFSKGQRGYYHIALGFAQIEDFKSALKYAKKIENQIDRDNCYYKIIIEMLKAGLEDKALKTVKKINEDTYIQESISNIIMYTINTNHNYKKAMLYATEYQNEDDIKLTKGWIIADMLKNNKIGDAIEFYKMNLSKTMIKNNIFNTVISTYLKQNDYKGLLEFMKKADIPLNDENIKAIIRNALILRKTNLIMNIINSLNDQEKDREYVAIAGSYIREHKYSEAYKILNKIKEIENRDGVYFDFARNYINDKNIKKALSYTDSISTFKIKDKLYSVCCKFYTNIGYTDEAELLLQRVNNIRIKEEITSDIAFRLFKNGEIVKFKNMTKTISDKRILDKLYYRIILRLLRYNQIAQIDEYLEKITDNNIKDKLLSSIARKYINLNDLEDALKYAKRIIDDNTRKKIIDMIKEKE